MVIAPTVKLNNGLEMPALGLGTYEVCGVGMCKEIFVNLPH